MLYNFLRLAWLFSAIFTSFANPYGNIGCHFSAVCKDREECVEDNLFGTCLDYRSVYYPYYDVSANGFRDVKIVIKYLLDHGYQWKDEAAQKSLQTVLEPFRLEYLDPQIEMERDLQRQQQLQELERMADQYGGLFTNYRTKPKRQSDLSPKLDTNANYFNDDKRTYLSPRSASNTFSKDDVEALIQEYIQAFENSPDLMEEEVNWLYQEYYQKYLDLVEQYRAYKEAEEAEEVQGLLKEQEAQEESPDYYNEVQEKLDSLKQYLEQLYPGAGEGKEEEEEEGAGEVMGGFLAGESQSSWDGSSSISSISEGGEEKILDDIDRMAVTLITSQLIPQMTPEEQAQWRELSEEEKEGIIEEALAAIDWAAEEMEAEEEMKEEEEEVIEAGMADGTGERIEPVPQEEGEGEEGGGEEVGGEEVQEEEEGNSLQGPTYKIVDGNHGNQQEELLLNILDPIEKKDETEEFDDPDVADPDEDTSDDPKTQDPKSSSSTGYVFITFKKPIDQQRAEDIIEALSIRLGLNKDAFSDISVSGKQLNVHVNATAAGLTPKQVAIKIADEWSYLASVMGVNVEVTGVGKDPVKVVTAGKPDNSALVILTVVLVACVVGILIAIVTVYCLRKRANEKAKVTGLKQGEGQETEASADYQDLCRQRMATKSEKPEPLTRVSSVAASEGAQPSPSSRSSTSSWSEEPVQSNMDISTGHVVLSYMEDHLNNKDRMSKEWEGLCSYEADQCSTNAAKAPENIDKNRSQTAVPYDHTRVKLNEATSANKSDYINASTIVDIDPRAPAYIATQAPLPKTLADFWQMIWEQGSVVIVNLQSHMSENDLVRCRYWPDEGSALYHVYEVHLVSEHVWCEDYLVRSFYLKNLETQETRTVTQFHFLTWPENGVPSSPKSLLEFRRKVNKSFRGRACPIVVHCSDGVGRTGTYCLLDLVLTRMMKGVKELDIAATLEHLRDQRPGMVQTKAQFEYALTAVVEEVNAILKALPQ